MKFDGGNIFFDMSVFIFYSIIYRSFIEIFAFFLQSQKDLVLKKLNYLTQLYHNRISHRESVFKSHQFARGLMANLSILGYFFLESRNSFGRIAFAKSA